MKLRYLAREQFAKGADLGDVATIALVKAGGIDGREIVGKDALRAFLTAEGLEAEAIERSVEETKADEVSFPFVLSTAAEDRQRDVINQGGWKLDNYRKNPVVLWAHDYASLPVARASSVYVVGDKLKAVDRFSKDHELAITVARLYANGFLNAVSVGFRPLKWSWNDERGMGAADFDECELLEHSAVPVPAHQDALIEARAAGHDIAPVMRWAECALASRGGLYLPKELIETALVKASNRITIDLGKQVARGAVSPEAIVDVAPAEVVREPDLAKALEVVRAAGLAVLTPDVLSALQPKAPPEAKPAAPEPKAVEAKASVAVDPAALRAELKAAFSDAFIAPLSKFVTSTTGRLD